jgi:sugar phosphate isomerase/epimerase
MAFAAPAPGRAMLRPRSDGIVRRRIDMAKVKIGLIGIVGDEYKKDFWAAAKRVAGIGYRGIEACESYLLRGDVRENVKRFHDLGLEVLTISATRQRLGDDLPKLIADAKAVGSRRVSCWWAPCDTRESVLKDADLYNAAGRVLAAEGIKLCYHHHDHEFRNAFNGVAALDILADHTDLNAVFFYVDIAWATFGGADPVAVIRRLGERAAAIHVKDFASLTEKQFTAVGTGLVNVRDSVRAAIDVGVEWAVVEQDKLRNLDAWETATLSYLYLKEAGLV